MLQAKLKAARTEAGFTQGQMARMLGYRSKSQYCMLERGHRKVTVETALRMAAILRKPVEELFDASAVHAMLTESAASTAVDATGTK